MVSATPQAIAGVNPQSEATIMGVYPSISSKGIGRLIGQICDCIPVRIMGVKISCWLFGLPMALPALIGYALLKISGYQFELTSRSVKVWNMFLGAKSRLVQEIPLEEISEIAVEVLPGQEFYHAGDVYLLKEDGSSIVCMEGIQRPEVFRQNILKVRDARNQTIESLKAIEARG